MKFINLKKGGFSLAESLIYIAIFGLIFTVIVQFSISTQEHNRIASLRKELGELIMLVNANIEEGFSSSSQIKPTSVFNNDNGNLKLNLLNGTELSYYLNNGKIVANRNSQVNEITSSEFTCNKFNPQNIIQNSQTVGVRITIRCVSIKIDRINSEFSTNYFL